MKPTLRILGTRGVPAAHGGFETFAEQLALYLVRRGWRVVVYCQVDGPGKLSTDIWQGIDRVLIPIEMTGPKATIAFDWKATLHAARHRDVCLTLGYNTAVFCAWLRLRGVKNVINMDGIEWARAKWSGPAKAWFWLNDLAGCRLGNQLVADHPCIADHLATRVPRHKITMVPYGAEPVTAADRAHATSRDLFPGRYLTLVARPEPENSVLEAVQGFSRRRRGVKLAVVGAYQPGHPYHDAVRAASSDEVVFLGAIYDRPVLAALRFHSLAYVHGHRVGGTNPSLVEALAAGNPVIAQDNRFNRWVAGDAACYFVGASDLADTLDTLLTSPSTLQAMGTAARARAADAFTWGDVLAAYESLLLGHVAPAPAALPAPVASSATITSAQARSVSSPSAGQ